MQNSNRQASQYSLFVVRQNTHVLTVSTALPKAITEKINSTIQSVNLCERTLLGEGSDTLSSVSIILFENFATTCAAVCRCRTTPRIFIKGRSLLNLSVPRNTENDTYVENIPVKRRL